MNRISILKEYQHILFRYNYGTGNRSRTEIIERYKVLFDYEKSIQGNKLEISDDLTLKEGEIVELKNKSKIKSNNR